MTRSIQWLAVAFVIAAGVSLGAQRSGPPPEIRALFDEFTKAFNSGSAESWEAFTQARFAPALLQKRTREQRADMYRQLVEDFGTIAIERVQRQGPSAPLDLHVKGTNGNGVISLTIEEGASVRIIGLGVEGGDRGGREPAPGVPPVPVDGTLSSDEINRRLDGYFTKLAADNIFSGVALVARNGVPVFVKAFGMADREKQIPNTIRTRFNIGSINKEFTQTAIRQLVRDGKLSPDDTLGKFFPDYPQAASRSATVQQLLSHRGGLADFFGPEFNKTPKDRFASNAAYFQFVGKQPPLFAPGERNQYCNGCYIALGAIVEKVSGTPYEKYVADNIFSRAEMTSTGYPRSDRPESDIAIGYTRLSDGQASRPQDLTRNTAMHGVTGSAAGGGYSTALDLLTYVKAVRAGKFPGNDPDLGIAGGAPGTNGTVEARGEWVVIVLTNFDPPIGERIGVGLADALRR
jgi:CubicO group peptidase (beta-lactamase class C family)